MYEQFFGLDRRPFSLAPDPDFLFWTRQHRLGATILELGVERQSPITLVTGVAGSGKTTLIRQFLRTSPRSLTIGLLSNYLGDSQDLYRWILMAFGQDHSGEGRPVLLGRLQHFFLAEYAAGRRAVLIVDEAQSLSDEGIELMRLLTNINVGKDVVMMLVLVGQPELRERLKRPDYRQIVQRIGAHFDLAPMTVEDTRGYIAHRLEVAGGSPDLIAPEAADLLHAVSGGIPRVVNTLGDMCLVAAYGEGVTAVDAAFAASVLDEARASGSLAVLPPMEPSRVAGVLPDPRHRPARRGPPRDGRRGDVVPLMRSGREALAMARSVEDEPAVAELAPEEQPVARAAPVEEPAPQLVSDAAEARLPAAETVAEPLPASDPAAFEVSPPSEAAAEVSEHADGAGRPEVDGTAPAAGDGRLRDRAEEEVAAAGASAPSTKGRNRGERQGAALATAGSAAAASGQTGEARAEARPKETSETLASAPNEVPPFPSGAAAEPTPKRRAGGAFSLALTGLLVIATGAGLALLLREDGPVMTGNGLVSTEGKPGLPSPDVATPSVTVPAESATDTARSGDGAPAAADSARSVTAIAPAPSDVASAPAGTASESGGTHMGAEVPSPDPGPAVLPERSSDELYRGGLAVAVEDPRAAAIAFARAAARGNERSAYFLAQMYETGDGVPVDVGLARAWYGAAGNPRAEARLAALSGGSDGSPVRGAAAGQGAASGAAPESGAAAGGAAGAQAPGAPSLLAAGGGANGVDLVWTSAVGPDPAGFRLELAPAPDAEPVHREDVAVSAVHLVPPDAARVWRVLAIGPDGRTTASTWAPLPD